MNSSELLDSIVEKYSEHLEMFGVKSEELIIKILVYELSKELEKNKYLERILKLQKVEENKKCSC